MQRFLPESPMFAIEMKVELSSKAVKLNEVSLEFSWTLAVTILMGDCLDPLQNCEAILGQVVKSITNQESQKSTSEQVLNMLIFKFYNKINFYAVEYFNK